MEWTLDIYEHTLGHLEDNTHHNTDSEQNAKYTAGYGGIYSNSSINLSGVVPKTRSINDICKIIF